MSQRSEIEWCDATWNPIRGCTKVSPGCKHCYAETFAERFRGVKGHPYEQGFDLLLVPEKLTEPLRWKKPRRIFVNSMSDLFQDGVPDEFIDRVLAVMALCSQHTFQVLTKRAERMRSYLTTPDRALAIRNECLVIDSVGYDTRRPTWPLPNVWVGGSVENQRFADERIPLILQTPAAVRFISAEPLLGPIDFRRWLRGYSATLDWIICGGESGHGARPFDVAWARSIVAQCQAAGVPVFVKQLGANVFEGPKDIGCGMTLGGRGLRFLDKKGGNPEEWPEDLRVREFPTVTV